jgi:hypothetical protein
MMLRAGLNLGESSYGIQVGLSKTHKRDFTASGYERKASAVNELNELNEVNEDLVS